MFLSSRMKDLLDLVITRSTNFLTNLKVGDYFSNHSGITFFINVGKISPSRVRYTSRNYKNIDIDAFAPDISSHFPNLTRAATLDDFENLFIKYDSIISELMDKHAPMKS